ncbi:MAG: PAC2 family protein [Phototrophicaceae bacterium]
MDNALNLRETPQHDNMYMLVGWRQWADAGSLSSGLPKYLAQETNARKIGTIKPDGFYIFQFPGTHDLARPIVRFENGYPTELETPHNDIYYSEVDGNGIVYVIGDEPHMDVERYIGAILNLAQELGVKRIVGFGGVFAEVPYDKQRTISSTYSLHSLKPEMDKLAVNLSDYHGGAAIGSVLSKRANERNMEYVSFYAFVPTYNLAQFNALDNMIRLENDFMAWLGVMRRVNVLINTRFDLSELESKSAQLVTVLNDKIEELQSISSSSIREYFDILSEEFVEDIFDPLDEVWESELKRLLDDDDPAE